MATLKEIEQFEQFMKSLAAETHINIQIRDIKGPKDSIIGREFSARKKKPIRVTLSDNLGARGIERDVINFFGIDINSPPPSFARWYEARHPRPASAKMPNESFRAASRDAVRPSIMPRSPPPPAQAGGAYVERVRPLKDIIRASSDVLPANRVGAPGVPVDRIRPDLKGQPLPAPKGPAEQREIRPPEPQSIETGVDDIFFAAAAKMVESFKPPPGRGEKNRDVVVRVRLTEPQRQAFIFQHTGRGTPPTDQSLAYEGAVDAFTSVSGLESPRAREMAAAAMELYVRTPQPRRAGPDIRADMVRAMKAAQLTGHRR